MSSPGRRSPSPRRRSPSPPKRSPRSPSPRRRSPSPRRRSPSPRRRSPSPRGRSPPPRRGGDSPRRREGPYYRPPPRVQGNERDRRNSTTLFVGNLPYHFRERDVGEYFERAGRVRSIKVGLNYRTGESKGYCFVEFETRRDAEDAFDRFQGYNLEGRRLRIDWDVGIDKKRKRSPRRSRSRSPRRRSPANRSPSPKRMSPKRSPSPPPRRDN